MKACRSIHKKLVFLAVILASSCTFSDNEAVEDGLEAADAGNQVVEVQPDDNVAESGIPNPEQVAAETHSAPEAAAPSAGEVAPASQDLNAPQAIAERPPQLPDEQPEQGPEGSAQEEKAVQPGEIAAESIPSLSEVVTETAVPAVDSSAGLDKAVVAPLPVADARKATKANKRVARNGKTAGVNRGKDSSAGNVYIVQPGDTLSRIAEIIFGSYRRWPELASMNGLSRDSAIHPGDLIHYPVDASSSQFDDAYKNLPRSKTIVQKGDTLSLLAERLMGQKSYWKLLWRWNEGSIAEPNKIFEGQSIEYITTEELTALLSDRKGLKAAH